MMKKKWLFLLILFTRKKLLLADGSIRGDTYEESQETRAAKNERKQIDQSMEQNKDKGLRQCRHPGLLSAFYGLDNAVTRFQRDGIPVVFSHEISWFSFSRFSFQVTSSSGMTSRPARTTLLPAIGTGELRTVLLLGFFGSPEDPPVKVEIVSNIWSKDRSVSFIGEEIDIVPLDDGPSLVLAEVVPKDQWRLGKPARTFLFFSAGTNCPEETKEIVRVTWDGGVTKGGGGEIDDLERSLYNVIIEKPDGEIINAQPFVIADLYDQDNNHELCLNVTGNPLSVSFPAGYLQDPAGHLNNDTNVNVTSLTDCI